MKCTGIYKKNKDKNVQDKTEFIFPDSLDDRMTYAVLVVLLPA